MDNEQINELVLTTQTFLAENGVEFVINIVTALAVFVIGKWIAKKIKLGVKNLMLKASVDPILISFLSNLVYFGALAFVCIAALGQVGVETASLAAVIAAAGLAIGLALQGSLSNFAAGVMIIIFRPFKTGDFIEAAGTSGIVEDISIFNTNMRSLDNKKIIVPNGEITSGIIVNVSAKPTRRIDLVIGVGYDDDLKKVKKVLQKLVDADDRILKEPAADIRVFELGESSVDLVVRPWVNAPDFWATRCDLIESIKTTFDKEGISIPYPQRDVHHITPPPANTSSKPTTKKSSTKTKAA